MAAIFPLLKKTVIFVHRWMGVVFCSLFFLWFASGIGMMYWDYPLVTSADRLLREGALNALQVKLLPEEAYARLESGHGPGEVRLLTLDGRPAYRFHNEGRESIVYADDGEAVTSCPPDLTLRIASEWTGRPAATAKQEVKNEEDQWTVSGEFRALRPLRKYSWADGQQVYVSTVTCEVVQYTTRMSRLGAYLGPIPHWLYFTPLRRRAALWSHVVIWAAGLGTAAALLGLLVGVWIYSPSKRYRYEESPSSIPYTGQKRWHMVLGLTFGALACTWAFSGMLSMDPFPHLESGHSDVSSEQLSRALRGTLASLAPFAARTPQQVLLSLAPDFRPKELELAWAMGRPVYFATAAPGQTLIIPVAGQETAEFDRQTMIDALQKAAQPYKITEARLVTRYESYYVDRRHLLPLPAIFVEFNDAERSAYYVDPKTARIVESYNSHSRWNRWLYHGLHSIDLPWLYRHRPAWDLVTLMLLLGGMALCVTALILAAKVVQRSFR